MDGRRSVAYLDRRGRDPRVTVLVGAASGGAAQARSGKVREGSGHWQGIGRGTIA